MASINNNKTFVSDWLTPAAAVALRLALEEFDAKIEETGNVMTFSLPPVPPVASMPVASVASMPEVAQQFEDLHVGEEKSDGSVQQQEEEVSGGSETASELDFDSNEEDDRIAALGNPRPPSSYAPSYDRYNGGCGGLDSQDFHF
ncbi:hypothetical protein SEMRO_703_G190050.1 [Seminavis robusta]|uniref:Uncharacterized protein n=1 Tax=Seminavis robusta TaxID=568900 RepID=A0A9N8HLU5_9STRA|nr:hypothetical protein SEMRO_703_G190050.1 [Seminavis robusta]|eukprot:Sro703_g190050.1 n/a (145) ;mRNA; f:2724-3158